MKALYRPQSEIELAIIKSLFIGDDIPFYVLNDGFGSLRPGPQIRLFNERVIHVPESCFDRAKELVDDLLAHTSTDQFDVKYPASDKLRMIVEILLFWWVLPGSRKGLHKLLVQRVQRQSKRPYLYLFSFQSPDDKEHNASVGTDRRSSTGLFIEAQDASEAISWGLTVSKAFVAWLYEQRGLPDPRWSEPEFDRWIEHSESELHALREQPVVGVGELPELSELLPKQRPNQAL